MMIMPKNISALNLFGIMRYHDFYFGAILAIKISFKIAWSDCQLLD